MVAADRFEEIKTSCFAIIRANGGRAITEQFREVHASASSIYTVLTTLEKGRVVARVPIVYKTRDNTDRLRRAWRIVGESYEEKDARCEYLRKHASVVGRRRAKHTPTYYLVLHALERLGATDNERAVSASQILALLNRRSSPSFYNALEDAVNAGVVDYVSRRVRPVFGRKKTRFYFICLEEVYK